MREAFEDAGFNKIYGMINLFLKESEFALQSAKEKLDSTLYYMQNQNECLALSFQDFMAELTPEK